MILAGVMDAVDAIPHVDRAAVIKVGLTSGSGTVRLAALPALAALDGPEAATARSALDPSEKVRAWANKHPAPTHPALGRSSGSDGEQQPADTGQPPPDDGDQPTLF